MLLKNVHSKNLDVAKRVFKKIPPVLFFRQARRAQRLRIIYALLSSFLIIFNLGVGITFLLALVNFRALGDRPATFHAPWVCYYTNKAKVEDFDPYKLCVFDSDEHPPLVPLKQKGKTLLGYISLGEAENHRPYFEEVKSSGILLHENKNWKGSYFIDMRDPRWAKRVIEEIIPLLLHRGFDGIFMDTLDNAEFLEDTQPQRYKGMKQAAINLVKAIRQNFPHIKIMMNRAFDLLPELTGIIDMEMAEVIYTHYNFAKKEYQLQPAKEYKNYARILKAAKARNPEFEVFTLDYWHKNQSDKIREIYARQRQAGFNPYVATIKLNQIIPEPGANHEKASH